MDRSNGSLYRNAKKYQIGGSMRVRIQFCTVFNDLHVGLTQR